MIEYGVDLLCGECQGVRQMHRESKAQTFKKAQYPAIMQFDALPYQLLNQNEIALDTSQGDSVKK